MPAWWRSAAKRKERSRPTSGSSTSIPAINKRSDWEVLARAAIKDERNIGDYRWRTVTALQAEVHRNEGDLTYGYAGIETGPLFDITKNLAVHTAIGGGAAYFDHRSLYNEGALSLTF